MFWRVFLFFHVLDCSQEGLHLVPLRGQDGGADTVVLGGEIAPSLFVQPVNWKMFRNCPPILYHGKPHHFYTLFCIVLALDHVAIGHPLGAKLFTFWGDKKGFCSTDTAFPAVRELVVTCVCYNRGGFPEILARFTEKGVDFGRVFL